jgi:hypothetical protein
VPGGLGRSASLLQRSLLMQAFWEQVWYHHSFADLDKLGFTWRQHIPSVWRAPPDLLVSFAQLLTWITYVNFCSATYLSHVNCLFVLLSYLSPINAAKLVSLNCTLFFVTPTKLISLNCSLHLTCNLLIPLKSFAQLHTHNLQIKA